MIGQHHQVATGLAGLGLVMGIVFAVAWLGKNAMEGNLLTADEPLTAPEGMRINAVSAGTVDTDALLHFPNREELLDSARQRTPAGRLVHPQDVANVVVYLCTEYASMIHGQTLIIDGGYSILA